MRAAIYTRTSTLRQSEEGTSPEYQRKACEEKASEKGWAVARVYHDAVSGDLFNRPELDRLLADCEAGLVDVVVVDHMDRLARDLMPNVLIRNALEAAGVKLFPLSTGKIAETDEDEFMLDLQGSMAKLFKRQLVRKMARGQRERFNQGLWGGGRPPYGYRTEPVDPVHPRAGRVAVPDTRPDGSGEADVARLAARLLVDDGLSTARVAERLNALGFKPRLAAEWTHVRVRQTMENEALAGRVGWAKQKGNRGQHRTTGKYGDEIRIQLDPIVTEEQRTAVLAALEATRLGPRRANKVYPLSKHLTSACGATYFGTWRVDRDTRSYMCTNGKKNPAKTERCDCPRIPCDDLEWVVLQSVIELLSDPSSLLRLSEERLRQAAPGAAVEGVTVESLETEIKRREAELERQVEAVLRAGVSAETLERVAGKIQGEIESLRAHQASLRRTRAEAEAEGHVVDQLATLAEQGRRRLENLTLEEQRDLYNLLDLRARVVDVRDGVPVLEMRGSVPHAAVLEALSGEGEPGRPSSGDPRPPAPRPPPAGRAASAAPA
nr:recombinase family protein [Nocardioides sp.]